MADQLFEIKTDDKDHQRAMRKMQKDLDAANARYVKLAQNVAKGTKEQKQFSSIADTGLGRAVTRVGSMLAGYVSVQGVVRTINAELQREIQLSTRVAEVQLRTAKAQKDFLINTAGVPADKVDAAIEETKRIALRTGVVPEKLFQPLAGAFSASGGDLSGALQSVETAARARPQEPESLASFILDVGRLTRTKDTKANAAVLVAALNEARTEDPGLFAANAIPAALNVAQVGKTSPEFALSTLTSLTTRLTDITGAGGSPAAATKLANALQDAIPGEQNIQDVLEQARQDPKLRAQVASKIKAGLTRAAVVELLDPESDVTKSQLQALKNLPKGEELKQFSDEFFRRVESTPVQKVERLQRQIDTISEVRALDPDQGQRGVSGVVVKSEEQIVTATQLGLADQAVNKLFRFLSFFGSRGPAFADELRLRQIAVRESTAFDPLTGEPTQFRSEQGRVAKQLVDEVIKTREAIQDLSKSQTKALIKGASRTLDQNVRD